MPTATTLVKYDIISVNGTVTKGKWLLQEFVLVFCYNFSKVQILYSKHWDLGITKLTFLLLPDVETQFINKHTVY